ncbi:MAG: 3-oxoadipate enol-lactonase [Acidimicrobiaceae bacterium]
MTVKVRGVDLEVDDPGGPGRPFVWGHGLTSSMASEDTTNVFDWRGTLGDAWRVVRYDARGHGASGASSDEADYAWPNLALDELGLLDALGLDRVVLGGASMGAATALHAAVLAPERVEKLVLVIPPTAWATRAGQAKLYRAGARTVQLLGVGAMVTAARLAPSPAIFRNELAGLREAMLTSQQGLDRHTLPTVLRGAASSDLPDPDALRALAMPALVLAWDTDPGHPVTTAEQLTDLLPGAELHVAREPAEVVAWPGLVADFLA